MHFSWFNSKCDQIMTPEALESIPILFDSYCPFLYTLSLRESKRGNIHRGRKILSRIVRFELTILKLKF